MMNRFAAKRPEVEECHDDRTMPSAIGRAVHPSLLLLNTYTATVAKADADRCVPERNAFPPRNRRR